MCGTVTLTIKDESAVCGSVVIMSQLLDNNETFQKYKKPLIFQITDKR